MESETKALPEILFISSYPPRECGIATFSQDLIEALTVKFGQSFAIKICALEANNDKHVYGEEVIYTLDTSQSKEYSLLVKNINDNAAIQLVVIQHEFGFYYHHEEDFEVLLANISKPIVLVFHTVLSRPNEQLKLRVQKMAALSNGVLVMTNHSAGLLSSEYDIPNQMISVIPHGTHLVYHYDRKVLRERYGFIGRKILSTFGLLSEGKNIETTLEVLPDIVKENPEVLFLILGKTHPEVVKREGEKYRQLLEKRVEALNLKNHVLFINRYLPLEELLNYLQLTDIYLFTSKDPNQAVSGTFAFAMSCACPIISTPIPHALEMLTKETGMLIDFENSQQLKESVNFLLSGNQLEKMSLNVLQRIVSTAWENVVISHASLFEELGEKSISLKWSLPEIKLDHVKRLTTDFGMIQFAKIDQPDWDSGYTLDDNSRALIAMCEYYDLKKDKEALAYINIYLNFIEFCQQAAGNFLNYVDYSRNFTKQNQETNLEDSNGRAIWALGFLISKNNLPNEIKQKADRILKKAIRTVNSLDAPRAMAFAIKGLYYENTLKKSSHISLLIKKLANKLVHLYKKESEKGWEWYEGYLTYANSILPEALLCAYQEIGDVHYKDIAKESFDFLLSKTFNEQGIKVISNKSWLMKGGEAEQHGEQPIDVAYTILALSGFYEVFKEEDYHNKMNIAFEWFLGKNHLHQIVYNPRTGGCYDGLERENINLNQGAESTVSYLMARLAVE